MTSRYRLSREDIALWRMATRDDARLPGRGYEETATSMEALKPPPETRQAPDRAPPKPAPDRDGPVQLPEMTRGSTPGLDRRSATRLRRGQYGVEDRIDLHGMTQEAAHRALRAFVTGASARGLRCVLVITGKGLSPNGRTGVLRQSVPRWLNEHPLRNAVLAFHNARPKDGGEGALYVLLRRSR